MSFCFSVIGSRLVDFITFQSSAIFFKVVILLAWRQRGWGGAEASRLPTSTAKSLTWRRNGITAHKQASIRRRGWSFFSRQHLSRWNLSIISHNSTKLKTIPTAHTPRLGPRYLCKFLLLSFDFVSYSDNYRVEALSVIEHGSDKDKHIVRDDNGKHCFGW